MKRLSDLGERKIINIIDSILSRGSEVIGIGDDCAAFNHGDKYLLISTDMITEKTHISDKMTPWQIGWFIVSINLSDIAAKGGKPLGLVLSLGLPKNTSESFVKEMMKGADFCAKKYKTSIVGGDTKENLNLTVCGTVFGTVKKNMLMRRKGLKNNDIIAVTGTLGQAAAGYYSLKIGIEDKKFIRGLFEPIPRINEGLILASSKTVNSCMDISDGLSSSLYQLCELNNIGFEIEKNRIPLDKKLINLANRENFDSFKYGLHFGGDYELLVAISPDKFEKIKRNIEKKGNILTPIGKAIKDKKIFIKDKGIKKILPNKGYEHFRKNID